MKIGTMNVLLMLGAALLSCAVWAAEESGAEGKPVKIAKKLSWTGCGIAKIAFMGELAKAYESKTTIAIALTGGGATKGIREVAAGRTDLGGSCRYVLPDHPEEQGVRMEPVAWDALVVIVNLENPVSNLTLQQLQQIFLGQITNWKELGGPDQTLRLYDRIGKTSGIGRQMRELVFANYDQDIVTYKEFNGSSPVEESVEKDQWGVGVTGISSAKKRKLKVLDLEGKKPTYENIKSGTYILYYPLYLVINATDDRKEILNFLQFAHSDEGRETMRKEGTVPYLDALHLVMKQINQKERARDLGLIKRF